MNALWWWIDRWRKSSAYMDMTLEQQGAYRNLLDEANLRGGPLPNDERVLAKACGDATAWRRVRPVVMARFTLTPDGWRNETLDGVMARSEEIRTTRAKSGRRGGLVTQANRQANTVAKAGAHTVASTGANSQAPISYLLSPSPDPDPISGSNHQSPSVHKRLSSADADFEAFLRAYPVSRRIGGKVGRAAFTKAAIGRHGDSLATALLALEQQKRSEQWQTPKLIPLMTTWLNQERWLQVLPEPGHNGTTNKRIAGAIAGGQAFLNRGES